MGLFHENGFYDSGENVGYFPMGIKADYAANIPKYKKFGPYYEDALMKKAEANLIKSKHWIPDDPKEPWWSRSNPNDYDFTTHNCQDFADALRKEYGGLGGKTCTSPFKEVECTSK